MPANGSFLLDTNIIIHLLNQVPGVQSRASEAQEVLLPIIAIGEIAYGAAKSSRPTENWSAMSQFLFGKTVLDCDLGVAKQYGEIKQQLRAIGKPIPENDIWIAAIALRWELVLVSNDQHFQHVSGLSTVAW